jgi:hypothetical protein
MIGGALWAIRFEDLHSPMSLFINGLRDAHFVICYRADNARLMRAATPFDKNEPASMFAGSRSTTLRKRVKCLVLPVLAQP